ncbi:MAG: HNH endonuclease [Chloroflexi bacterium]|nr:HNH endonuclease [Chloroflexota bacterium]
MVNVIATQLRDQVRSRFLARCAYCHTPESLTVTTFEIDHIVPFSAGGDTAPDNLCLSCPTCNRHKGVRQSAPDPDNGDAVPLYHPQKDKWNDHFLWNTDTTQIIGLTPTGRATIEALHINRPQVVHLRKLWAKMGETFS